jgi:CopG family transcriptional regulator, nickel-responsive regulator
MKKSSATPSADPIQRMSVTIPESLLRSLDQMVAERGFENRSQAVAELIQDRVSEHQQNTGNETMAGSITLFYDQTKNNLLAQLAELQRQHVAEVISSLHVQLEQNFMMEVILVQGPAQKLKHITNALVACKGVKAGKLTLTSLILPPLHEKSLRRSPSKPKKP